MTWVEWYAATLVLLTVIANVALDGDSIDPGKFGARRLMFTLILNAPIYGRVFGWW